MKDTKIGFCIPDFDPVRLKDFLSSNDAGKWGSDPNGESDIAVVRSTNFNDTGYLDLSDVALRSLSEEDYQKTKLLENDIVIERSGGSANQPVGRVSFVTKEIEDTGFGFSNFIQRIRVSDEYNAKYIFYCLYHLHSAGITQTMQTQTNGIRNLEYRYYLNQKLPKPSPTEQTQIANFLSTVDKTIQATKNSIAKLEKLKTSLMQNLLTGKMKPDGSWRTEDEFWIDDKFGKVPNGWKIVKLKNVASNITMGQSPSSETYNYNNIGLPFVQGNADMGKKYPQIRFNTSDPKKVSILNDLLLTVRAPVGDLYINNLDKISIGRGICALTFSSLELMMFVYYSLYKNNQFIRLQQGTTFTEINQREVKGLILLMPDDENEIKSIQEKITTVVTNIEIKEKKIQSLISLKKSLMQNLLTGKVRLPQEALKQ